MKLKVPVVNSQRDSKWASKFLGTNTTQPYTIGNYGCLITTLGNYIGRAPDEVNELLKANAGFVNGGLFVWSKSTVLGIKETYLSPRFNGPVTSQGITKIKELLDQGKPSICEVDFNPSTVSEEQHYVLLMGYEGDTIFAADPWTGEIINLDVYGGSTRAIIQYRGYDKALPIDTGVDQHANDLTKMLNWDAVIDYYNKTFSPSVNSLDTNGGKIVDQKFIDLQEKIKQLEEDGRKKDEDYQKALEAKDQDKEDALAKKDQEIQKLQQKLAEATGQSTSQPSDDFIAKIIEAILSVFGKKQ